MDSKNKPNDLGSYSNTSALMQVFMKGDRRCPVPVGGKIRKSKENPENNIIPVGTRGTVMGNAFILDKPCYLVLWDYEDLPAVEKDEQALFFILGEYIERVNYNI